MKKSIIFAVAILEVFYANFAFAGQACSSCGKSDEASSSSTGMMTAPQRHQTRHRPQGNMLPSHMQTRVNPHGREEEDSSAQLHYEGSYSPQAAHGDSQNAEPSTSTRHSPFHAGTHHDAFDSEDDESPAPVRRVRFTDSTKGSDGPRKTEESKEESKEDK